CHLIVEPRGTLPPNLFLNARPMQLTAQRAVATVWQPLSWQCYLARPYVCILCNPPCVCSCHPTRCLRCQSPARVVDAPPAASYSIDVSATGLAVGGAPAEVPACKPHDRTRREGEGDGDLCGGARRGDASVRAQPRRPAGPGAR